MRFFARDCVTEIADKKLCEKLNAAVVGEIVCLQFNQP